MNNDINQKEAAFLKLPGHDLYIRSHLAYYNDLHRDHAAYWLYREAYISFADTFFVMHRRKIFAENVATEEWMKTGGLAKSPSPLNPYIFAQMERQNLENFKIAAGFELALKASIIEQDFVIHIIDKKEKPYKQLAAAQKERPIGRQEVFAIDSYRFDGKINYLPGLSKNSLNFSTIVQQEEYRSILNLSPKNIDVIDEFRQLRNQIHFPGDIIETPIMHNYIGSMDSFLFEFINSYIVDKINYLHNKIKFGEKVNYILMD